MLEPHMISGLGMAIQSATRYFWNRKDNNYVYLDTKSKSRTTRFIAEKASEDTIYLKGESGKYLEMVPYNDGNIYMRELDLFPSRKCELQVVPYRGRVAFRLKENGKFLQDEGNMNDLIAKGTSLNEKTLFTVQTGSIRDVKEKIVDITFRNSYDIAKMKPTAVQSKVIVNKGSQPAVKVVDMSWSETKKQTTTWENNWNIGVSSTAKGTFDSGFAKLEMSVTMSANVGGKAGQGAETSNTLRLAESTRIVIPPKKMVTCDLMLRKVDNAELKFTAKIERESDAGITTFYQDGVWKGMIVFNSFVTISEEDIKE